MRTDEGKIVHSFGSGEFLLVGTHMLLISLLFGATPRGTGGLHDAEVGVELVEGRV